MVDLNKVTVDWSGPAVVGAGSSTFWTTGDPTDLVSDLRAFFSSIQTLFPNGKLTWTFPTGGPIIESTTGVQHAAWTGGTATPLPCASSNAIWSQGVGGRIAWDTPGFHGGRRTRGATYLVPLNISMMSDSDGTLVGSAVTTVNAACAALVATHPTMQVWTRNSPGAADGGTSTITGGTMRDAVSWLRSRRT